MTSIAFTAGVVPLVLSTGAGAEMRNAMGVAVFAGMLGVTLFGLLLTPVFYWIAQRLTAAYRSRNHGRAALEDTGYLRASVAAAAESKQLLYDYCERRGWAYWPSEANFVLIRVGDAASALARALADRDVLVRDKSAAPGCAGCLRITAGVVAHTRICIEALEAIRAAGAN